VCRAVVPAQDGGLSRGVDVPPLQVVVDGVVPHPERHLVGDEGLVVLEVGGGDLVDQLVRHPEVAGDLPDPAFREAEQRRDVSRAVAELRVEADDRLRGLVRAHHQHVARAGDRVLRDHALARLHVALHEVVLRVADREPRGEHLVPHAVRGGADVHGVDLVGPDDVERLLRVVLVRLHAVRQPHRDEACVAPGGADPLAGELAQQSAHGRVHATRDPQDETLRPRVRQVLGEETDAALGLASGVEVPHHLEFRDDAPLQGPVRHGSRLVGRNDARASSCLGDRLPDGADHPPDPCPGCPQRRAPYR